MSVNKVVVGALLGALVGYCGIASARYVESDPVGLTGGINTYAYAGGNPISNFDPSGLYCTSAGGMTTCSYPGGPSFRLPTPQGFPTEINASMRALYHKYDVQQALIWNDRSSVKCGASASFGLGEAEQTAAEASKCDG